MTNRYMPGEYMVPEDGAWSRNDDVAKQGPLLIDSGELAVSDPIDKQVTTTSTECIYVDGLGSVPLPTKVYVLNLPSMDEGMYFLGAASLPDTCEPSDEETAP